MNKAIHAAFRRDFQRLEDEHFHPALRSVGVAGSLLEQSPGELGQLFAWLQDGGDPEPVWR